MKARQKTKTTLFAAIALLLCAPAPPAARPQNAERACLSSWLGPENSSLLITAKKNIKRQFEFLRALKNTNGRPPEFRFGKNGTLIAFFRNNPAYPADGVSILPDWASVCVALRVFFGRNPEAREENGKFTLSDSMLPGLTGDHAAAEAAFRTIDSVKVRNTPLDKALRDTGFPLSYNYIAEAESICSPQYISAITRITSENYLMQYRWEEELPQHQLAHLVMAAMTLEESRRFCRITKVDFVRLSPSESLRPLALFTRNEITPNMLSLMASARKHAPDCNVAVLSPMFDLAFTDMEGKRVKYAYLLVGTGPERRLCLAEFYGRGVWPTLIDHSKFSKAPSVPLADKKTEELLEQKHLHMERLAAAGIPVPRFRAYYGGIKIEALEHSHIFPSWRYGEQTDAIANLTRDFGSVPVVVKPLDSYGGQRVHIIDDIRKYTEEIRLMLSTHTPFMVQERVVPDFLVRDRASGRLRRWTKGRDAPGERLDWNLRVFVAYDPESGQKALADIAVRVGREGYAVNLTQDAFVLSLDDLCAALETDGEKLRTAAMDIAERAARELAPGQPWLGMDLMVPAFAADADAPSPLIIEANGIESGCVSAYENSYPERGAVLYAPLARNIQAKALAAIKEKELRLAA